MWLPVIRLEFLKMADLEFYNKHLKTGTLEELTQLFLDTLVGTNRTHEFFVDWGKVRKNIEQFKIELGILNSLLGTKNFEGDLKKILVGYPEVLSLIPMLIAVRETKLKVIEDFGEKESDIVEYSFHKKDLNEATVNGVVEFFRKTGLESIFTDGQTKNLRDYLLGVEVGMDTHARKNRSGHSMEIALSPLLKILEKKLNLKIYAQKKFKDLHGVFGTTPTGLADRKFDFVISRDGNAINLEADFFATTGSKPQEIVDSYINRCKELNEVGWGFIFVTDGGAWQGQRNQISKAIEELPYTFNLNFVRRGLLEKVIEKLIVE